MSGVEDWLYEWGWRIGYMNGLEDWLHKFLILVLDGLEGLDPCPDLFGTVQEPPIPIR
jgi:hypothetical protein